MPGSSSIPNNHTSDLTYKRNKLIKTMAKKKTTPIEKAPNAQTFLLNKIVHEGAEYPSLGTLKAEYVGDISKVMEDYAIVVLKNIMARLENGESIKLDFVTIKGKVIKTNMLPHEAF